MALFNYNLIQITSCSTKKILASGLLESNTDPLSKFILHGPS